MFNIFKKKERIELPIPTIKPAQMHFEDFKRAFLENPITKDVSSNVVYYYAIDEKGNRLEWPKKSTDQSLIKLQPKEAIHAFEVAVCNENTYSLIKPLPATIVGTKIVGNTTAPTFDEWFFKTKSDSFESLCQMPGMQYSETIGCLYSSLIEYGNYINLTFGTPMPAPETPPGIYHDELLAWCLKTLIHYASYSANPRDI